MKFKVVAEIHLVEYAALYCVLYDETLRSHSSPVSLKRSRRAVDKDLWAIFDFDCISL